MDELQLIFADTSNEELTPEKKIQYNNVRCSFSHFSHMNQYQIKTFSSEPKSGKKELHCVQKKKHPLTFSVISL